MSATHEAHIIPMMATMECYRLPASVSCMRNYEDAISRQSRRSLKAGQLQRVEVKHVSRIPMVLFQGLR